MSITQINWSDLYVIYALGFTSSITWTIMGVAVGGALIALYCERAK